MEKENGFWRGFLGGNDLIMLLSDWYLNWKEKRIKAAAEKARAEEYEKGYADGRAGVEVHRRGHRIVKRESDAIVTTHRRKS